MTETALPDCTLSPRGDLRWAAQTDDGGAGVIVFKNGCYWSENSMRRGIDDVDLLARNILSGGALI